MVLNIRKKGQRAITSVLYDGTNLAELQTLAPAISLVIGIPSLTINGGIMTVPNGYYLVKENSTFYALTSTEFAAQYDSFNDENKGRLIIDQMLAALVSANLTPTEKSQLVTKLNSVYIALIIGEINGARFLANAATTDAVYTAGRKTFLLNLIDAQLL